MATMDHYKSLVNHVFLPPKLPQSSDEVPINAFVGLLSSALSAFKGLLADPTQQAPIDQVIRMTQNVMHTHPTGLVNAEMFEEQLSALPRTGGTIILHIGAQNAGVLVSRHCDASELAIRFEVFELSPTNSAVFQCEGRLVRAFPGTAVDVDLKTFTEPGLVETIAHTLAKMSFQSVPGMQPRIRKAGDDMDEDRDTTHPGMVSEFLLGVLSAVGHSVATKTISKNTREEVLWQDARSPWRRSPVWLLLNDQGVMGGVNTARHYASLMGYGHYDESDGLVKVDDPLLQGGLVAVYYLPGTFIGALWGGWLGDRYGRIRTIGIAALWAIIGAALQCSSQNASWMFCGMGAILQSNRSIADRVS
ncbi:hypothetical protein LTR17_023250 [Elasticomyces elasticus]|nr:hypothetical protein LTR17_023250 [Elasticomyces elasticus]